MKKTILILLLAAVGITGQAQSKKSTFKFKSESIGFGRIQQGNPVETTFQFVNTGNIPLIINEVKPTCGCTAADFSKTPIKPGKSGYIKITYNAATLGPFNKTIIINSNSETPAKEIRITGEVVNGQVQP